jgi:hypothetical protein
MLLIMMVSGKTVCPTGLVGLSMMMAPFTKDVSRRVMQNAEIHYLSNKMGLFIKGKSK